MLFNIYYCSNYGQETFEEFLEHCTNFMQTLAEVQKGYAGRIVCVGPPPFYEKGTSLADYQEAKKSMRKVSESLSLIGYALDKAFTLGLIFGDKAKRLP